MALPCRAPWCNQLVTRADKGFCEKHKDRRNNWRKYHTPNTKRLKASEYKKLRALVLERDGYICVLCKQDGRLTPATEVDHIKAITFGGINENLDTLSNLRTLCTEHHRQKTAQDKAEAREREKLQR